MSSLNKVADKRVCRMDIFVWTSTEYKSQSFVSYEGNQHSNRYFVIVFLYYLCLTLLYFYIENKNPTPNTQDKDMMNHNTHRS